MCFAHCLCIEDGVLNSPVVATCSEYRYEKPLPSDGNTGLDVFNFNGHSSSQFQCNRNPNFLVKKFRNLFGRREFRESFCV